MVNRPKEDAGVKAIRTASNVFFSTDDVLSIAKRKLLTDLTSEDPKAAMIAKRSFLELETELLSGAASHIATILRTDPTCDSIKEALSQIYTSVTGVERLRPAAIQELDNMRLISYATADAGPGYTTTRLGQKVKEILNDSSILSALVRSGK